MLSQFSKLAFSSVQLREAALRKEAANVLGLVGRKIGAGAKSIAIGGAIGGALEVPSVIAKTKEFKSGFDPQVRQQMLGQPPTPPGA